MITEDEWLEKYDEEHFNLHYRMLCNEVLTPEETERHTYLCAIREKLFARSIPELSKEVKEAILMVEELVKKNKEKE